jgi:dCTP deaminase
VCGEILEYSSDKYQNSRDIQPSLLYKELGAEKPDPQLRLDFENLIAPLR